MPSGFYYCYFNENYNDNISLRVMNLKMQNPLIYFPPKDSILHLMLYDNTLNYLDPRSIKLR